MWSSNTELKPKRKRVIEHVSASANNNWNKDNPTWNSMMLLYDKNFLFVETCIEYDNAIAINNLERAREEKEKIYNMVDKAYQEFKTEIENQSFYEEVCNNKLVMDYLNKIPDEIKEAKRRDIHPRDILELTLIKLSILRDCSQYGPYEIEFMGMERGHAKTKNLESDEYAAYILDMPIFIDTKEFKRNLGQNLPAPGSYQDYPDNDYILPVYSKNGTMGFNTVLYAIFNGYYPIGFGITPHPVHLNYHDQHSFLVARHDYAHSLCRLLELKKESPEYFHKLKDIYFTLFAERLDNTIDDVTFRKELLMLFYITYERGRRQNASVEEMRDQIIFYTKSIEELSINEREEYSDYQEKKTTMSKEQRQDIKKKLNIELRDKTVIETIDFVKPLRDLGYEFPPDKTIENSPWKAAPYLRKALLDMQEAFLSRHPDLFPSTPQVRP